MAKKILMLTGEFTEEYEIFVFQQAMEAVGHPVDVVCPGFAADCLETLEEIAMENAGLFKEAGGESFAAIPCLNDSDDGMRAIRAVVSRELQGWL